MKKGHQNVDVPVGRDEIVAHVTRMGRGVAEPSKPGDLRQLANQIRQRPGPSAAVFAMIRVHVLAQERELARARFDEPARFLEDVGDGARILQPARVGHHAEGTELVAPFLNGEKRGRTPRRRLPGQRIEPGFDGKRGIDDGAPFGLGDHVGKPVVRLGTEHDIDPGRSTTDLLPFGLRDAPGHGEHHGAAVLLPRALEGAQTAQLGVHLLRRLLADMARVQNDHVGARGTIHGRIAQRRQNIRHAGGVVDVHLTTVGLDEEFLGQGRSLGPSRRANPTCRRLRRFHEFLDCLREH